jgi:hypothetical protein
MMERLLGRPVRIRGRSGSIPDRLDRIPGRDGKLAHLAADTTRKARHRSVTNAERLNRPAETRAKTEGARQFYRMGPRGRCRVVAGGTPGGMSLSASGEVRRMTTAWLGPPDPIHPG